MQDLQCLGPGSKPAWPCNNLDTNPLLKYPWALGEDIESATDCVLVPSQEGIYDPQSHLPQTEHTFGTNPFALPSCCFSLQGSVTAPEQKLLKSSQTKRLFESWVFKRNGSLSRKRVKPATLVYITTWCSGPLPDLQQKWLTRCLGQTCQLDTTFTSVWTPILTDMWDLGHAWALLLLMWRGDCQPGTLGWY